MTPSGTIHTVYDRDGNLLMESNGLATGITREYIWLPETQIVPMMGARAGVARPLAVVDAVNTASPQTHTAGHYCPGTCAFEVLKGPWIGRFR